MYYSHNTYTMATGHVLFYVWLSSLVMQVGESGGEAPRVSRGVWGAARPPHGGSSIQLGGSSKKYNLNLSVQGGVSGATGKTGSSYRSGGRGGKYWLRNLNQI